MLSMLLEAFFLRYNKGSNSVTVFPAQSPVETPVRGIAQNLMNIEMVKNYRT